MMTPLFESSFLEKLFSSINQISDAPPPNPFPHLASSFSTPTTEDIITIKDAIGNSSSDEEFIEKLLSRLGDVEKTLQARLNAERDYKSQLRGMLSTTRLLPPEVLSNIFRMCLPNENERGARFSNRSIPWSISRVCRKWRCVCLETPRLWGHLPTICLKIEYKPGFFELLRTAMELSFPHDIELRLQDGNATKIEQFENVLPRVHSLIVHADLSMIKGLVQKGESFRHLKSVTVVFISSSSEEPPTLDFLTPVTSLTLSCCYLQTRRDDPTLYALLRAVDSHWPNLTSFLGDYLPATFLRKILFAAPLLRKVRMFHIGKGDSSTAGPAPSDLYHVNLKYLILTCRSSQSIPRDLFQHLHLPGLKTLYVEHVALSPEPFLSFLRETCFSVVNLRLKAPFGTLDDQRKMYTLCPALKIFTLSDAEPKNLGILAMPPQSDLCPALRRLTLHNFALGAANARVFQDFCSSRGPAPINGATDSFRLDCITVYPKSVALFRQHCLHEDDDILHLLGPQFTHDTVRHSLSIPVLRNITHVHSDIL